VLQIRVQVQHPDALLRREKLRRVQLRMLWPLRSAYISIAALHTPSALVRVQHLVSMSSAVPPASPLTLRPLVCCGPSGAGKGTLIGRLLKENPQWTGFSVSHTTRKPRPGEVDGEHYHFCTPEQMDSDICKGIFLEVRTLSADTCANVIMAAIFRNESQRSKTDQSMFDTVCSLHQQHAKVHGNSYGTSMHAVEKVQVGGRVCVLDIDCQGVRLIKEKESDRMVPHYVFIAPPNIAELERRLRGRGTEAEEAVKLRIANAQDELKFGLESGFFEKIIVNDDVDVAYNELLQHVKQWYPEHVDSRSPAEQKA
jgi:guanylate kinase